ncbi:MAG: DinB family protein [Phycisphaerales bacterium]
MSQTLTAAKNTIAMGMLEEFEREVGTTRRFLERLWDAGDKMSWKPHAKSMSVGQLAHHIAETPGMVLQFCSPDRANVPNTSEREEAKNVAALLQTLDESAAMVREILPTMDDARMKQVFTIDLPDGNKIELPRQRFVRAIMLNHWYHHRGQLGVYLRLLGVAVPSSYGPSGDEPPAPL